MLSRQDFSLRYYLHRAVPLTRFLTHQMVAHRAIAIFSVIALEEIGVPLPLPGDVFIAYAGHLVVRNRLSLASAFFSIVFGSMVGASVLYWLARRYGQPFVDKYGPYMHIKPARLEKVERGFRRWGPLVIILGRQVPGTRMVISVFAGLFGVPYLTFVSSVALAAALWAATFLAVGIRLDRQIGPYMTITPLHLLPSTVFISFSIIYGVVLKRRADAAKRSEAAAGVGAGGDSPVSPGTSTEATSR
ncbi:MAG TPA: DedA family protein [Candidatus Dormibacteraeota bacterium]|nr:DedA family protein [Candidatus Dormibacteraeota bacterium]